MYTYGELNAMISLSSLDLQYFVIAIRLLAEPLDDAPSLVALGVLLPNVPLVKTLLSAIGSLTGSVIKFKSRFG